MSAIQEASDVLVLRGQLRHHKNWVTSIATPSDPNSPSTADMLLTASRDRTLVKWRLTREEYEYGTPERSLQGHAHFIQDVVLSSDAQFALSASWDGSLRLWDLNAGVTTRRFVGHTKDVLSVAFSSDNRQIVSGSRDRSIKLWNTIGECKYSIDEAHSDWVTCVRFSPNVANPIIVSGGCDKLVKVWNLSTCKLRTSLAAHKAFVNTVTVSPDGSLCASGGRDGQAMLWDLNEGKHLYALDAGSTIHTLCFSPNRYWLCAGTDDGIKIWHLESKNVIADRNQFNTADFRPQNRKPACTALAWSADGTTLYAGYTDGVVRVWGTSSQ